MGNEIQPSQALRALLDGEITDAEDVESRRSAYNEYISIAEDHMGVNKKIQALWSFHTASLESVLVSYSP